MKVERRKRRRRKTKRRRRKWQRPHWILQLMVMRTVKRKRRKRRRKTKKRRENKSTANDQNHLLHSEVKKFVGHFARNSHFLKAAKVFHFFKDWWILCLAINKLVKLNCWHFRKATKVVFKKIVPQNSYLALVVSRVLLNYTYIVSRHATSWACPHIHTLSCYIKRKTNEIYFCGQTIVSLCCPSRWCYK